MHGLNMYDYSARYMDPAIGRFTTVDPLAESSYSQTPYHYCSNNPINRIDPTGMKDSTYVAGVDKPVSKQPGTATPVYKYDANGNLVYDANGNPVLDPNAKDAYNCHSYAWENSQGDPNDPRNSSLVAQGVKKWDQNPDNNMQGNTQLNSNTPNQKGDRVIYYVDSNGNGKYDKGENIVHSAVVNTVDKNGNTKTVISKMGQDGISINHPTAPGFYSAEEGQNTSRAYFRSTVKLVVNSPNTYKPTAPKVPIAVSNAINVKPVKLFR